MIRPVTPQDIPQICDIYNYYVKETVITFETELVSTEEMMKRVIHIQDKGIYLVCENEKGEIAGYCYINTFRERIAFQHTAEISIYLNKDCRGQSIGSKLYTALLEKIKTEGLIHTLVAGITTPNPESIRFHEKFGFVQVAGFKEVGYKFDQWLDVGFWQKMI